jgi:hypothetical protein
MITLKSRCICDGALLSLSLSMVDCCTVSVLTTYRYRRIYKKNVPEDITLFHLGELLNAVWYLNRQRLTANFTWGENWHSAWYLDILTGANIPSAGGPSRVLYCSHVCVPVPPTYRTCGTYHHFLLSVWLATFIGITLYKKTNSIPSSPCTSNIIQDKSYCEGLYIA